MPMEFKGYLKAASLKLDQETQKILGKWLKEVGEVDEKLIPFAKAFKEACKGGKGIRGALVMLGYQIASSKTLRNDVVRIGAAYEIFHNAILTHDDIMDESSRRRGKVSLYKKVGTSAAITLGDIGFFLAVKIIAESNFLRKSEALKLFAQTVINTGLGQILDIEKANPYLTAKLKTAEYTVSAPIKLGAILAGADEKLLGLLGKLGMSLGIAYQIRDDVLDAGTLDSSGQKALKYVAKAKKIIPNITLDDKLQKLLEQMADYIIERRK